MFKSIGQVLPKIVNKYNIKKPALASYICFTANDLFSSEFTALSFDKGILTIQAGDHFQAQELRLNQTKILDKLNGKLGGQLVEKIRFRVL